MSIASGVIPWLWLYRRIGAIFLSFSGKRERRTKHKSRMRGGREQQREALRVRLLPTLRGRVFHLTKLNSNLKASELFRRTYFQIKVIKSGMISDLRESLRGVFAATAHHDVGARFSCYFHILFTSRTWQNSHVGLFAYGKIFAQERSKVEESPR